MNESVTHTTGRLAATSLFEAIGNSKSWVGKLANQQRTGIKATERLWSEVDGHGPTQSRISHSSLDCERSFAAQIRQFRVESFHSVFHIEAGGLSFNL